MKNNRTIRTLRRASIDTKTVGFAGFTPTGKYVRRMARRIRAEKRMLAQLPPKAVQTFFRTSISPRQSVKLATRYLRSHAVVQAAWLA